MAEAASPSQSTAPLSLQQGPYLLRKLVSALPLSADSDSDAAEVNITCVEVWSMSR